jgi:hypothetical protein
MLSVINKKLFNNIISEINKQSELHFILENLVLKKKNIYLRVKEYNFFFNLSQKLFRV